MQQIEVSKWSYQQLTVWTIHRVQ